MHEFDLYSAFISSRSSWEYIDIDRNFITLFKDKVIDDNNFDSMMFQATNQKIKFFAIHHEAFRYLKNNQIEQIKKFWVDCGLFESIEAASKCL